MGTTDLNSSPVVSEPDRFSVRTSIATRSPRVQLRHRVGYHQTPILLSLPFRPVQHPFAGIPIVILQIVIRQCSNPLSSRPIAPSSCKPLNPIEIEFPPECHITHTPTVILRIGRQIEGVPASAADPSLFGFKPCSVSQIPGKNPDLLKTKDRQNRAWDPNREGALLLLATGYRLLTTGCRFQEETPPKPSLSGAEHRSSELLRLSCGNAALLFQVRLGCRKASRQHTEG